MAVGRILNRALLQAASAILNLEGVKQFPPILDLGDIKVTYDLGNGLAKAQPNNGKGSPFVQFVNVLPVGLNEAFGNLIWTGVLGEKVANATKAYRIESVEVEVIFDAAGALALNGKKMAMELMYSDTGGDPPANFRIVTLWPWANIVTSAVTSQRTFRWCLGGTAITHDQTAAASVSYTPAGTWRGAVPALAASFGSGFIGLRSRIFLMDGVTAFPANTTFTTAITGREATNGFVPDP